MKIATETLVRSERDEKIISNLRQKMHNYAADLTKAERDLAKARVRVEKYAED